jgi:hypothetical protein
VAKPNYHHARKQKELARKTRQQEKKQKRLAGKAGPEAADLTPAPDAAAEPAEAAVSIAAAHPISGER